MDSLSEKSNSLDLSLPSSRKRKLEYSDSHEKEEQSSLLGTSCQHLVHPVTKGSSSKEEECGPKSDDIVLKQLSSDLKNEEEHLRKLKLVKMYREKNNLDELGQLIDKWRDVCQQALQDLQELLPSPRPSLKELLDHLQIEYELAHFDPDDESFT